jgi:prepilin-type N-terminal cleavage/methylation domain-containing protein
MSGKSTEHGFTMVELIIVMILVGILAAYAVPKFAAMGSLSNDAWRDQVKAALRYAQKAAVSHRRLVCVDLSASTVAIQIASAHGATACNTPLGGPGGSGNFGGNPVPGAAAAVSPAGTIYFQPDGRATALNAGVHVTTGRSITVTGTPVLQLFGETGYVQ